MKVYGYICPPATGSYIFWIASDDNAELWLSTTSSSSDKTRIAYHTLWTNSREWNKYATQKSAAITLTAGQLYYVEALMKEGSQGDNMAVGWAKPGEATTAPSQVIPGSQLMIAIPDAQPPAVPANLNAMNIGQTSFLLTWTASTDNIGVAGYDVYRNGTKINTSLVSTASYNVTGLTAGTLYSFTVIAKDAAGNSSATSAALPVSTLPPATGSETFTQRTVIAGQRMPHDLAYGPDNNIWYTERFAGTVSFVNPATGVKKVVLALGSKMVRVSGQDGLMGLALHPQLLQGKPYVYISYTYQSTSSTVRKIRIERYTYDIPTQTLGQPVTVLEDIPGSNDHNSARLAIGPDLKLYYTAGDMGAGQFDNLTRTNNAQNLTIYEGKVLRLNTEPVNSSWIPTDNPFGNAVYTNGHRNAQGLVWGNVNGANILYSSEHGPYSDDEINIIEAGRNYGWPQVSGFCDGNYNGRTIGGFAVVSEQTNCTTLNAKEPIRSLFPATNPPTGGDNMTWPSTGPSGTDFYGSNAIPGWQNSLLVAQLKNGTLTRFKLSNDGTSIISDTIHYFRGIGRFRDVVVSPDGLKIYLACDSSGSTSGPTGGVTTTPANPGSILEFTYQPPTGARTTNLLITGNKIPDDIKNRSIDIYPNPASTFIIVYNYGNETGRSAELFDLNGRVVKKQAVAGLATRLNVNTVSNGLYILRITDTKGRIIRTEKINIQK
jgi:glucose/arabinose dehydrogenase